MLHRISSLDDIRNGVILFDNPDELKANRFSILDVSGNFIRVIQTETNALLKVFLINNLLSEEWWISGNGSVKHKQTPVEIKGHFNHTNVNTRSVT
ncbi:MAG: hypothetical protein ABIY90_11175 [Puia sp.]